MSADKPSGGKPNASASGARKRGVRRPAGPDGPRPRPKASTADAKPRPLPSGGPARQFAVALIRAVQDDQRFLEDALASLMSRDEFSAMEHRDRALARLIAATVLRRQGQIDAILKGFLKKPLPNVQGGLWAILQSAAAQLLFVQTPPHAAINIAVEQCRLDRKARRFDKLANAILRKVAGEGPAALAEQDEVRLNTPDWLWQSWTQAYGDATARRIAAANLGEAALDLTVKGEPARLAERLGAIILPTGSVRLKADGRIEDITGFKGGAWWVQDAAASLPARLLGEVAGKRVADLCAAPGGKTAQLAQAGAQVTAVDISANRLQRLAQNIARLSLKAETVTADILAWAPDKPFDAVLLDAPCSATGTMRRHPDIRILKSAADVEKMATLQSALLDKAAQLVAPGGTLVYCTCSLEPEEGEHQAAAFLARHSGFERRPIAAGECGIDPAWITPEGDLRTLPCHLPNEDPRLAGMDGFFAMRLRRTANG